MEEGGGHTCSVENKDDVFSESLALVLLFLQHLEHQIRSPLPLRPLTNRRQYRRWQAPIPMRVCAVAVDGGGRGRRNGSDHELLVQRDDELD